MNINFNILRILLIYIILIPLIKSEISGLNTDIVIDLTVVSWDPKSSPKTVLQIIFLLQVVMIIAI